MPHKCSSLKICFENLRDFLKFYDKERVFFVSEMNTIFQLIIKHTEVKYLRVSIILQNNYPLSNPVVQVKCNEMSENFIEGTEKLLETKLKECEGCKLTFAVTFLNKFLDENHLGVVSKEISLLKTKNLSESDSMKLKKKTSEIELNVKENNYFINVKILVPYNYPKEQIKIISHECNLPKVLKVYLLANATEIARKCVQPPIAKLKNAPPFKLKRSLKPFVQFLCEKLHKFALEECKLCDKPTLNPNASKQTDDQSDNNYPIKLLCDDIFHTLCLDEYMMKPPFNKDGKACIKCGEMIHHGKWRLTADILEKNWASYQARQGDMDAVNLFCQDLI